MQCINDRIRNGAVKRIKLEAGEAPIAYEAFVEELDEGDSFTATLIEVLVKVSSSLPIRGLFQPGVFDSGSFLTVATLRLHSATRGSRSHLYLRLANLHLPLRQYVLQRHCAWYSFSVKDHMLPVVPFYRREC